jgi:spermidine synthase
MVGPWSVRLAAAGRSDLGRVAGMLSGLSAAGSILGTFLASLVALPMLGTSRTILAVAALLLVTGGWGALRGRAARAGVAITAPFLAMLPIGSVKGEPGTLYERESAYQFIQVRESAGGEDAGWRRLYLDEGQGYHSVLPASGYLTGAYWDFMNVLPAIRASDSRRLRILSLGLAAGTMARQLDHYFARTHDLAIDGVEIDAEVVECGRRFFRMGEVGTLTAHVADGRAFLAATPHRYDIILVDVFRQPYIPFHMATREFFELCRSRLAPGGLLAMNVGARDEAEALLQGFSATLKAAFPHVARYHIGNFDVPFTNYIYVAADGPLRPPVRARVPRELWGVVLPQALRTWTDVEAGAGRVFTDDRAPVEMLTNQMILRVALGN